MGVKLNQKTKKWDVSYSQRHPITKKPRSLKRIGIKSKAEAMRVYNSIVYELKQSLYETECPKWRNVVAEFSEHSIARGLRVRTVDNYVVCLEKHTFDIWGDRLIDTIKTVEITELLKIKLADKSPSHQKSMLKFINGVMSYALDKDYIQRNPTPKLKFRIGDKLKGVLTRDQAKLLLDKAKEVGHEWYPIWMVALYTGMRNGELYALTWDKVDIRNRQMMVSSSWSSKDGWKDFTKSGDDRIVEIAQDLIPLLQELKISNSDSVYVLPRIDKWDRGEQARELRMFLQVLGLPRIRFHDLRASWCTMMLSLGVEPVKVMKMGGWKDLKTLQIYFRKAGIEIKGITNNLSIHNPKERMGQLLSTSKW